MNTPNSKEKYHAMKILFAVLYAWEWYTGFWCKTSSLVHHRETVWKCGPQGYLLHLYSADGLASIHGGGRLDTSSDSQLTTTTAGVFHSCTPEKILL